MRLHVASSLDVPSTPQLPTRPPREIPPDLVREFHHGWVERGDISTAQWLGEVAFKTPPRFGTGPVQTVEFIYEALEGRGPMVFNTRRNLWVSYHESERTDRTMRLVRALAGAIAEAMQFEQEWLHKADVVPYPRPTEGPSLRVVRNSSR